MAVAREDVILSYKLFLGRQPESEDAIIAHQNASDLGTLRKRLISSPEFLAKKSSANVLLIGNCQSTILAALFSAMTGKTAKAIEMTRTTFNKIKGGDIYVASELLKADLVIFHDTVSGEDRDYLVKNFIRSPEVVRYFPSIYFPAFHPDMDYLRTESGNVAGELGEYNSLLAYFAFREGLDVSSAMALYCDSIFDSLGYYDMCEVSKRALVANGAKLGIHVSKVINEWLATGSCFMHSMNHPKKDFLADVLALFLSKEGIDFSRGAASYVNDALANSTCWQPYPEVAKKLGVYGEYCFKKSLHLSKNKGIEILGLREFLIKSYETFEKFKDLNITSPRLDAPGFVNLKEYIVDNRVATINNDSDQKINPYKNLPSYRYWRRSFSSMDIGSLDPVINPRFTIQKSDKVATAGSCFAQHISRTLSRNGFNYYVVEQNPNLDENESFQRNFGVFSARYGNLYTARQLQQLFDQAFGFYKPEDDFWIDSNGQFIDRFRPQIEPSGFANRESLLASRNMHLEAVREMFRTLDVFVFTLGLTEAWVSDIDGAVVPIAPGVTAVPNDGATYSFKNFNEDEIECDMQIFIDNLLVVNPKARVILTVSPVPLIATFEDRHVLTATTYSKSVLRVVADNLLRKNSTVDYFPSYEIITGNYTQGAYYENDLRSVCEKGVSHVMKVFLRHYGAVDEIGNRPIIESALQEKIIENSIAANACIVCDEEVLDN